MILIIILLSLGAEKSLPSWQDFRRFGWFANFAAWARARLGVAGDGPLGVLLIIAPVTVAVGLIAYGLYELHGLLGFLFAVLVLWFCLGPKSLDKDVQTYLYALEADDRETAHHVAAALLREEIPSADNQLSRAITESILVQANERLLAVLFWFIILGPFGAALYRLTAVLKNLALTETSDFSRAARRLQAILDWVPARLTGLGYAISGSFVNAIGNWRGSAAKWAGKWEQSSMGVLVASGTGALQLDADSAGTASGEFDAQPEISRIKSAQALVSRTVVVWVLVIALLTLAFWAG